MPKKTKKEKILAMYHKKLRMLEDKQAVTSPVQIKTPVNTTKLIEPVVDQYFFSDLKKSLLLITLIIGVEVGLYFAGLIK